MDRLTQRNDGYAKEAIPVLVRGRGLGPAGFNVESMYQDYTDAMIRLCEYENAEEEGRLVRLPYKVGGTAYSYLDGRIRRVKITGYRVLGKHIVAECEYKHFGLVGWTCYYLPNLFPTRDEAKAAMKKGKGGEQ